MSEEIRYLAGLEAGNKIENIDDYKNGYHNGYISAKRKFEAKMLKEIKEEKNRERDLYEYYPYNVIYEAFSEVKGFNLDAHNISPKSILDQFKTRLEMRERDIIELIFKNKKTLEYCGERYGISRERVRQIKDRILFKLRNQNTLDLLETVPKRDYLEAQEEIKNLKLYITENKITGIPVQRIVNLPVSLRCINALGRRGILNTRDLELLSFGQIKSIAALGKKSIRELSEALKNLGYTVNETDEFDQYIRIG